MRIHWNELASFIDDETFTYGSMAACSEPNADMRVTDIPVYVTCKRCRAVMRADANRMLATLSRMARGMTPTTKGWKR